ncbi:MipA/OmpV family protein [Halomonas sp. KG2]|uniref:MipA/OmpV family protein n=1 Tax=Halomonas sp. KG2 TaxID=2951138 RepID=UPI0026496269|nr:MipA/OmpV family protein [Halomonas sp. KG2]WKD29960.1 MipA/OmpV family protein [Halomonas sp. KG2]
MKIRSLIPLATAILATYSPWSFSQEQESADTFAIGLIAYTEPSLYVGGKDNADLLPYIEWESDNWFFRDYSLGSYLAGGDNWALSAAISYDAFGDVERGNSPELKDMKKLDDIYTAAVSVDWFGSLGYLTLGYRQDISGNHNGGSAVIGYGYPLEFQQWRIEPHVSLTYAGSQVARYYVGVDADDVKVGRPAYRPEGAYQYQAGISLSRSFGESHRLLIDFSQRRFSDEVHDSPIVDNDHLWSISAGYLYAF